MPNVTEQQIQIRRGTEAEWTSANPTPAAGEWTLDTTSGDIKIGDGVTAWADLTPIQHRIDFLLMGG
jgi:hypothetical protein